jgi:LPXTG-motif cell wall-anchored protein
LSTGAEAGIGAGLGALLVVAAAYLFYRKHRKMKNVNDRVSYQPKAQHYEKPVSVSIAHHMGDGYNKPYSDATSWLQVQQSPQAPQSELAATR